MRTERLLNESTEVVRALGRNRRDRSFETVPDGFDQLEMRRRDWKENQRDPQSLRSRARELRDIREEGVRRESLLHSLVETAFLAVELRTISRTRFDIVVERGQGGS